MVRSHVCKPIEAFPAEPPRGAGLRGARPPRNVPVPKSPIRTAHTLLFALASFTALPVGCTSQGREVDELHVELPMVAVARPSNPQAVRLIVGPEQVALDDRPLARPDRPTHLTYAYWREYSSDQSLCWIFEDGLRLATEFEATAIEVEADQGVDAQRLSRIFWRLSSCDITHDLHKSLRVRTPAGLGTLRFDNRLGPVCPVEDDAPWCSAPMIDMSRSTLRVTAYSGLAVPPEHPECLHGKQRSKLAGHQAHSQPPWDGRALLEASQAQTHDSIQTRVHTAMLAGAELAPPCRTANINVDANVPWSDLASAVAIASARHGFAVLLHVRLRPRHLRSHP